MYFDGYYCSFVSFFNEHFFTDIPTPASDLHEPFSMKTADLLSKERKNFKLKFYIFLVVSTGGIAVNCAWIYTMSVISNGELWNISDNGYGLIFTDYTLRNDSLSRLFPRIYNCNLKDFYGITGGSQNESYLCSLPINHNLEIFFVAFWSFSWCSLTLTVLEFLTTCVCLLFPNIAMFFMPSNDLTSDWLYDVLVGMNFHERAGLIVVLMSIKRNISTFAFKPILKYIHQIQKDKKQPEEINNNERPLC